MVTLYLFTSLTPVPDCLLPDPQRNCPALFLGPDFMNEPAFDPDPAHRLVSYSDTASYICPFDWTLFLVFGLDVWIFDLILH